MISLTKQWENDKKYFNKKLNKVMKCKEINEYLGKIFGYEPDTINTYRYDTKRFHKFFDEDKRIEIEYSLKRDRSIYIELPPCIRTLSEREVVEKDLAEYLSQEITINNLRWIAINIDNLLNISINALIYCSWLQKLNDNAIEKLLGSFNYIKEEMEFEECVHYEKDLFLSFENCKLEFGECWELITRNKKYIAEPYIIFERIKDWLFIKNSDRKIRNLIALFDNYEKKFSKSPSKEQECICTLAVFLAYFPEYKND